MSGAILYVVIVETGEYSDRNDWVGGVFDSREVAERMILEKSAAAREHSAAYGKWRDARWAMIMNQPKTKRSLEEIDKEVGPAPTGEPGEAFYLVEVPMNQWGQFSYAGASQ